jgi:hypothetical protein
MTKQNLNFRNRLLAGGLLLILGCANPSFAQQRWSIGPRVGANISNFTGDIDNNKWLPGWSAGGFIMYSSVNHFGISGDILYSQKGARFENVLVIATPTDYIQRINYLEIPVLARYFLTLSGSFRPNFFIGPSLGLKLNAKLKNIEQGGNELPDRDVSDQFRTADLGLTGGFAFNFQVAPGKRILLDARYTYGLTDITLIDINMAPTSLRNSAITLNLSYGFGVGKNY